jgi:hypothetical protein
MTAHIDPPSTDHAPSAPAPAPPASVPAPPGPPGPSAWIPGPPSPPPSAPQRRGGRRRWLVVAAVAVVVIAGLGVFLNWQREQNYQTGHQAYLKADCAGAVGPLRSAAGESSSDKGDVALKARAELQECDALLAADRLATDSKPGEAVLGYSNFVTKYERSALKDAALASGQKLIADAPGKVASVAVCDVLETLEAQRFFAPVGDTLPPFLYACGQAYGAKSAFADALAMYGRFRAEYPEHSLAGEVEKAFADATLAETAASGAGSLPPPRAVGKSGEAGGQATVVIQNDSPERLSMVFSGPDVRVEEMAACADCVKFTGAGPRACPRKGPVAEYVLAPGTYEVVVKSSSGSDVTPFRGTWTLKKGEGYTSCFYLVSR